MDLSDFDYVLPPDLIAQEPAIPKDSSRLLALQGDRISHLQFSDITRFFQKGDVLVLNETKVSRAKIRGAKTTGGQAEIILCGRLDEKRFQCRISGHRLRIGNIYVFPGGLKGVIEDGNDGLFTMRFNKALTPDLLENHFELPGPPYIEKKVEDHEYQTIYATRDGSLAAPTAGLHFTEDLLLALEKKGVKIARVCLHVGFGTFFPVRGPLADHVMHEEWYEVGEEAAGIINRREGRLFAVGTTSVRTLESASDEKGNILPGCGTTRLFIYPGYVWKTKIDGLITNFHLPRSTLLLLVSAYMGRERILDAYKEAIKEKYRFYSLGDAMLLIP